VRADIVVVGGGFAGLSAAYHLAARGRSVLLLERDVLGGEASGRNTGMLGPGIGGPITALVGRHGSAEATRVFQATLDAVEHVLALVRAESLDCDLEQRGQLLVARTDRQAAALRSQAETFERLGFRVPWLDEDALAPRLGTNLYRGALLYPSAANLDPRKLVRELARAAQSRGARILERVPVRAVRPGRPARVELDGRTIDADLVVLATNAFTAGLGFLRGRVVPLHTHVISTVPLDPATVRALGWPGREGVVDARRFFNYFRLTADDRLLFGGGAPAYRAARGDLRAGATRFTDPRQWERLERELALVFPSLAGAAIEDRWAGVMGFTLDRLPVVGELAQAPGVLHAGGWCGHGVAFSIASGAVIADLAGGRESVWARLPWMRGTAPWLVPDPLRAAGLRAYLGALGLADRIAELGTGRTTKTLPKAERPTLQGAST
jgi:gamma-glutamylputrescine oxidase